MKGHVAAGANGSSGRALLIVVALFLGSLTASAEDSSASRTPEGTIRAFYSWYVQALVAKKDPFESGRAKLQQYATARLMREIDKARKGPDGLDGDYFLDAQDFDADWARNISVSHVAVKGTAATADVQLKGRNVGMRDLHVTLVQEHGAWKVDQVTGK